MAAKEPAAKKSSTTKAPAKKAPAKQAAAKKAPAKKAPAKRAPSSRATAVPAANPAQGMAALAARMFDAASDVFDAASDIGSDAVTAVRETVLSPLNREEPAVEAPQPAASKTSAAREAVKSAASQAAAAAPGTVKLIGVAEEAYGSVADAMKDLPSQPVLPADVRLDDVALGAAVTVAEVFAGVTAKALKLAYGTSSRIAGFARGLAPQAANDLADSRLTALAEKGRSARQDSLRNASSIAARGITIAATDPTVKDATMSVLSGTAPDMIELVVPAVLEAVGESTIVQDKIDELLGGLLVRTLPSALERTLPQVVVRTAAAPVLGRVPGFGRRSES